MDISGAVKGVLSVRDDGTLVAYDPQVADSVPFIVHEAFGLGHRFGYVTAMMRLHTFDELPSDEETLRVIETAGPTPQPGQALNPQRGRIPRLGQLRAAHARPGAGADEDGTDGFACEWSPEPTWVVETLVQASGRERAEVDRFLSAAHHVVDDLVTDDVLVIAPPLVVGRVGCPVWERVRYLVKDEAEDPLAGFDGSAQEVAESLSLPVTLVERYPTAGLGTLALEIADLLGVSAEPELRSLYVLLEAWLDTYASADGSLRGYRVRPAGPERHFEDWLVQNLHVLAEYDYPVRLAEVDGDRVAGRQVPVHGRRSIADLVCVVTADTDVVSVDDLVVVENKTSMVDAAADQLARYVDFLRASTGRSVRGLLIADGVTVDAGRALHEYGLGYLTLAAIGYRTFLRSRTGAPVWDPDETSAHYPGRLPTD
jgi:hypothetical protein